MDGLLDVFDEAPWDRAGTPVVSFSEEDPLRGVTSGLARGTRDPKVHGGGEPMAGPPVRIASSEVHGGFGTGGPRLPRIVMQDTARFVTARTGDREV